MKLRGFHFWLVMTFYNLDYRSANEQAQLVRSHTWEEKFSRVRAAVSVDLTAARYGLRTLDYRYWTSMKTWYTQEMHLPSLMMRVSERRLPEIRHRCRGSRLRVNIFFWLRSIQYFSRPPRQVQQNGAHSNRDLVCQNASFLLICTQYFCRSIALKPSDEPVSFIPQSDLRITNIALGDELADAASRTSVKLTYQTPVKLDDDDEDDEEDAPEPLSTTVLGSLTPGKVRLAVSIQIYISFLCIRRLNKPQSTSFWRKMRSTCSRSLGKSALLSSFTQSRLSNLDIVLST